jgi:Leucine-rich repeat (LRR) protein
MFFDLRFSLSALSAGLILAIGCTPAAPLAESKKPIPPFVELPGAKVGRKNDQITQIDFRACGSGWKSGLSNLDALSSVDTIQVAGPEADDSVAEVIGSLPNLRSINFEKSAITDVGVKHLSVHTKLRSLKLGSPSVTDASLKTIAGFSDLVALSLQECSLTDEGFEALTDRLTQLKEVAIFKANVSAGPLKAFASSAKTLSKLNLRGTQLTSQAWLEHGAVYANLADLEVSETKIDDGLLPALSKHDQLKALNVWRTQVTDQGLESLVPLGLTRLNLDDNAAIGDPGMEAVAKMVTLEWLHVGKTKITDEGVKKLEGLANLAELRINDTLVSDEAIQGLQAKIEKLKKIVK